jgi:hypothetical protein
MHRDNDARALELPRRVAFSIRLSRRYAARVKESRAVNQLALAAVIRG